MLWSIAWRNIWRNKKRSLVLICAVGFGLWAGLLTAGLTEGYVGQMVSSAIDTRVSHIQIHQPEFLTHLEIGLFLPDGQKLLKEVRSVPGVKSAVGRSVITGMCRSATTAAGVVVYGIDPQDEIHVTDIHNDIVEGTYFETGNRNPVVIGQKLAEKLDVHLGSKIVINAQDPKGDISAGAFRVVGIYKTVASEFDKTTIFALDKDLSRVFDLGGRIHEIAIMVDKFDLIPHVDSVLVSAYPELDVETWGEIEPEMAMLSGMARQQIYIFMGIILLALVFGITNTMLMGVLERVRELGVVIALGMKHGRVFAMVLLETIFLSLTGAVLGIITSIITITILSRTGIDLTFVSEGLEAFGMAAVLYPVQPIRDYPIVVMLVILTALIAAVYPGLKATKLKPAEAIRVY
jgi:ABC-type lipoprotein release transport system permease subunit